jgi:hypothetical protein
MAVSREFFFIFGDPGGGGLKGLVQMRDVLKHFSLVVYSWQQKNATCFKKNQDYTQKWITLLPG